MNLKSGKLIGVINSKNSWLYCEITKVDGDEICACVINGNWDFKMNVKTGEASFRSPYNKMEIHTGWRIGYYGPIPREFHRYDYNRAIDFMEEQTKRNKLALWYFYKRYAFEGKLDKFKRACEAFSDVWNDRKKAYDPWDDDIAF